LTALTETESTRARMIGRQFVVSRGRYDINGSSNPIFCHPSNYRLTLRIATFGISNLVKFQSHLEDRGHNRIDQKHLLDLLKV
jgi:hypothetical protein